jgi:hypothetical protein
MLATILLVNFFSQAGLFMLPRNTLGVRRSYALNKLDAHHPRKLKLFETNLLQRDLFLTAMNGYSAIFHIASLFLIPEKFHDPKEELFRLAVKGPENILESVDKTESVRRVILISLIMCSLMIVTMLLNFHTDEPERSWCYIWR